MGLTEKQIKQLREELDSCKNPLYFFHDDPDGLCSFLLLYRYIREGNGVIVKATPNVDDKFLKKVEEYSPDKIFVLDLAMMENSFIEKVKVPIVWIDHHEPQEIRESKVRYFNPRLNDKNDTSPVSLLCYEAVEKDLWIASVGITADWHLTKYHEEFSTKYPKLLPKEIKTPEDALFKTELGKLSRIFSFILMGKINYVNKYIKTLTRIKDPYEILEQKTSAGKFIYRRYEQINEEYERLLKKALKDIKKEKYLVFNYTHEKISFSKDLANELLYNYPDRIIIIGRERSDEIKMSLRAQHINILKPLEKALVGIDGYGGGHEHACGACVKKQDYKRFIENLKKEIG